MAVAQLVDQFETMEILACQREASQKKSSRTMKSLSKGRLSLRTIFTSHTRTATTSSTTSSATTSESMVSLPTTPVFMASSPPYLSLSSAASSPLSSYMPNHLIAVPPLSLSNTAQWSGRPDTAHSRMGKFSSSTDLRRAASGWDKHDRLDINVFEPRPQTSWSSHSSREVSVFDGIAEIMEST